eukprot:TRINITY_DN14925_c0_g1_i1.p1 TRINITY_DN14925_c0_g1~~TRINITY_DN14925_c0_g1_i1.p1  ORF type:complete len:580 (+),score=105.61 TRINITY_DN14925_c0_g1_i1:171-1742(+)
MYGVGMGGGTVMGLGNIEHHPVRPEVEYEWAVDREVNKLRVDAEGEVAVVAQGDDGMGLYKIENGKPEKAGNFKVRKQEGAATFVAKYKNYAYIFLHTMIPRPQSSVVIADISDIYHPFFLTKMDLEGKVVDSLISDRTLYAVTKAGRVYSWDITKPKIWKPLSKIIIGTDDDPLEGAAIDTFMDFIYIGAGTELYMYLLREGESPVYVSKFDCEHKINDLVWFRGFVYVATVKGLQVVKVQDPAKPVDWGFRETAKPAVSVKVLEFTAIVATSVGVVHVIAVLPPRDMEVPVRIALSDLEKVLTPVKRTMPPKTPMPTPVPTPKPPPATPSPPVCGLAIRLMNRQLEVKQREVYDGVRMWSSLVGSKMVVVPPWLIGAQFYTPEVLPVPAMSVIEFACCADVCDLFIIIDHCSDCVNSASGGIMEVLLQEGWSLSYCSPRILPSLSSHPIPTVTFRKQVSRSEIQTLATMPRYVPLVAFAVVERETRCIDIKEEHRCKIDSFCAWLPKNERCVPMIDMCEVH